MSIVNIYKKFNKQKLTDTSENPDVEYYDYFNMNGDSTVAGKYVYVPNVQKGMAIIMEEDESGAPLLTESEKPFLLTGQLTRIATAPSTKSAIITKATVANPSITNFNDNRDASIHFELFDGAVTLASFSKINSLRVQRNFPNSKTYQLMNGGTAKYVPNVKHNISIALSYLTSNELEDILNFFQDPVLIVPENDSGKSPFYSANTTQVGGASKTGSTITIDSSLDTDFADNSDIVETIGSTWGSTSKYFHWMDGTIDRVTYSSVTALTVQETITGDPGDKNTGFISGGILTSMRNFDSQGYFYCNLVGNTVDFQYTTTMKDTGYSGTLNFQEI